MPPPLADTVGQPRWSRQFRRANGEGEKGPLRRTNVLTLCSTGHKQTNLGVSVSSQHLSRRSLPTTADSGPPRVASTVEFDIATAESEVDAVAEAVAVATAAAALEELVNETASSNDDSDRLRTTESHTAINDASKAAATTPRLQTSSPVTLPKPALVRPSPLVAPTRPVPAAAARPQQGPVRPSPTSADRWAKGSGSAGARQQAFRPPAQDRPTAMGGTTVGGTESVVGGSASSLREILEKAERMGREEVERPAEASGSGQPDEETVQLAALPPSSGNSPGEGGESGTPPQPNGIVATATRSDKWQRGMPRVAPGSVTGAVAPSLRLVEGTEAQEGVQALQGDDSAGDSAPGVSAGDAPSPVRPSPVRPVGPNRPTVVRPGAPPVALPAQSREGGGPAAATASSELWRKGDALRSPGSGGPRAGAGGGNRAAAAPAAASPASLASKSRAKDGKKGGKGEGGAESEGKAKGTAPRKAVSSEQLRGNRRTGKQAKRAAREEAVRAAAPIKAEILEVGKGGMSVAELAGHLAVNVAEVVRTLFLKGIVTMVTQILDEDMVRIVCAEHGVEVLEAGEVGVGEMARKQREFLTEDDLDSLVTRPPVVTVMGHVDHGKTSLLDFIRKSKVAAGEAGGITQGIGAYRVAVPSAEGEEHMCVFLDTPGHEAFSAMRARGARVTDIAVIVVAADDGVRPQTLEAVAHARAAGVPMVVAINKIDKEGASVERVMQELSGHGVMPEDWGGDVPMVPVSARTGENVDKLLETIMLVGEFQELQANPDRPAVGTVIEAQLDRSRGPVATLLVQNGSLSRGDVVLCGETYGKVRALLDDTGVRAETVGPSTAVEVMGLSGVPVAGDEFEVVDSVDAARQMAAEAGERMRAARLAALQGESKVTLAALAGMRNAAGAVGGGGEGTPAAAVELYTLNVILKVDCQGSVEAIREALQALPQDTVSLRFLLQAPGDVAMSDLDLAVASKAVVLCFNVNTAPGVEAAAAEKGVEVRRYRVIYDIVDDVRRAMEGLLGALEERRPLGEAEVRAVFGAGSSRVAGVMVTEGKLVKGCGVSVHRGKSEVHVGMLDSLRRVKEAAKEVVAGLECGVGVNGFNEWQEGDIVQAFELVKRSRSLEDASLEVSAAVEKKASDLQLALATVG